MRSPLLTMARGICCLCLTGVAAGACRDEPAGPAMARDAAAAEALLGAVSGFATVAGMVEQSRSPEGIPAELAEAESLWLRAGEADRVAAARLRAAAARLAAPHLAATVPAGDWARVRAAQRAWLETAAGLLRHLDAADSEAALRAASDLMREAEAAAAQGFEEEAALATLLAGARLAETTPAALSRRLTEDAETRLAAWSESEGDGAGDRIRRVERLVDGARSAYAEGDYLRSARRANYALQMMEAP